MMDTQTMKDAKQAYALMGDPFCTECTEDGTVTNVLWEEALVRQRLNIPLDDLWDQRVLKLEAHRLARIPMWRNQGRRRTAPRSLAGRARPSVRTGVLSTSTRVGCSAWSNSIRREQPDNMPGCPGQ
jgi:hypothetical protein